MAYVVLDIGAGSRSFGRILKRSNRHLPMSVFCGEPDWARGPFFHPIPEEKKQRILSCRQRGVWRVRASYSSFEFPDESLDMVTLNAPHPFSFEAYEIGHELQRCLKPGGLFFSSYPRTDMSTVPKTFELLREGRWRTEIGVIFKNMPPGLPSHFPQSPCISHNIRVHRFGNPRALGTSYLYFDGISPGYKLWRKPTA